MPANTPAAIVANKNVRCQGCGALCSKPEPSSLVSVKACQGEYIVFYGVTYILKNTKIVRQP